MEYRDLVGLLLPPFIDIINSRVSDNRARYWIAMVLCFAIGILINLDKIQDPKMLLANASLVFTSAQITYHTYWEQADVRRTLGLDN